MSSCIVKWRVGHSTLIGVDSRFLDDPRGVQNSGPKRGRGGFQKKEKAIKITTEGTGEWG